MKKLLGLISVLFLSMNGFAVEVWLSSSPATSTGATGVVPLCSSSQRGVLHGVCTNFGVASSSVTIVNSTYTLTGVSAIGPISTFVADQCKYYDVVMPKGMGYNKPNTTNISILYQCY